MRTALMGIIGSSSSSSMIPCVILVVLFLVSVTTTKTKTKTTTTTTTRGGVPVAPANVVDGYFVVGWVPTTTTTTTTTRRRRNHYASSSKSFLLFSSPMPQQEEQQEEQKQSSLVADVAEYDPDAPAGIGGAEFFGGNKQKEEFYDPVAEENIGLLMKGENEQQGGGSVDLDDRTKFYNRFFHNEQDQIPTDAFQTAFVASVGQSIQRQVQSVLYEEEDSRMKTRQIEEPQQSNDNDNNNGESSIINKYDDSSDGSTARPLFSYPTNRGDKVLNWETPFDTTTTTTSSSSALDGKNTKTTMTTTTTNPLQVLRSSKEFYKKLDVAIVGGRELSTTQNSSGSTATTTKVELFWEISVVWPTFWAPHVLLTGSSTLDVQQSDGLIVKQVDRLWQDGNSASSSSTLVSILAKQITPRFWDWYHIGMSPPSELMPRMVPPASSTANGKRSLLAKYDVHDVPGRLMTVPTMIETGTRDNRNAETVPDHAFTCYIKTMGPSKQEYVPTTPVEIKIGRESGGSTSDGDRLQLSWSIPLSVEFQAKNEVLSLPGENPEATEQGNDPKCSYQWVPPRRVATIPYGGNAQDLEITDLRKQLYEQVTKDGWKPKLDESGRPQFFFWQNNLKACYTDEGLGMCVYEWRPEFAKSNEVGIELDPERQSLSTQ